MIVHNGRVLKAMQMRRTIERLRAASKALEPGTGERAELTLAATAYAESFLSRLPELPAFVADARRSLPLEQPFAEEPGKIGDLLQTLAAAVDSEGVNAASGGLMGYIPGGGLFPSALGDFLADVSNRYAGVSFASPGAAKLEQSLVKWMCGIVGLPAASGGDLTSGGSIANLTAIVTARETMGVRARDVEKSCVYTTTDVHHCIDKALRTAGLGDCRRRRVEMDRHYRMDVADLQRQVERDVASGHRPWLVVASAGTTDTGAVDPLAAIAELARKHDLWLHVDAAYGGFFMLCEEGREVLAGLRQAQSVVLDPHKSLFLPYGSGAVLVRDVNWLARAQTYQADYMQDVEHIEGEHSPADLSLELTRPFRGLRMWLPLRLFGVAAFRSALAEKIWLARYFHEQLSTRRGWELGPYPDLSVVTYRYVPARGDADAFNRRLIKAVQADGRVFITSTRMDGHFVLRLAALSFRTHIEHVDYLLGLLDRLVMEFGTDAP
jgi:glutamate/tyrosine decarboxylase-like PLP-dependent enzyme